MPSVSTSSTDMAGASPPVDLNIQLSSHRPAGVIFDPPKASTWPVIADKLLIGEQNVRVAHFVERAPESSLGLLADAVTLLCQLTDRK